MLCNTPCKTYYRTLRIDGVWMEFSLADQGAKVCMYHVFHTIFGFDGNSWGTMVTSRALGTSAVREMSLLTSSPSFQRWTSLRTSRK